MKSESDSFGSMPVPEGWSCTSLIECTSDGIISYGVVQPGRHVENGVPIVRVNNFSSGRLELSDVLRISPDIEEKYQRTRLQGGEVLLTLVGSTGQSAVVPDSLKGWNVPRAIAVIRVDPSVGAQWVNLCLQTRAVRDYLDARANTTVQKTLNLREVKGVPITIPPDPIKEKIEEIEYSISEKIENNNRTNKSLEAIAQALFKSWFVDFEPVKAKMAALKAGGTAEDAERAAMQAISGKSEAELDSLRTQNPEQHDNLARTAALFPSAMVESELGEIPEGWRVEPLDSVAKYQNGLALQKYRPEKEDEYLPVVKIAQLRQGYADGEEKASPKIKKECIIEDGDVVFSWSGSLMVDTWCGGRAALNQHLFKVTSKRFPKWFYYHFTRHHLEKFQSIAASKAVTMGHIKREHLRQALCVVPPKEVIVGGNSVFGDMLELQIGNRLESRTLKNLRDTLLPRLLSGELTLPAREERAPEAVDV